MGIHAVRGSLRNRSVVPVDHFVDHPLRILEHALWRMALPAHLATVLRRRRLYLTDEAVRPMRAEQRVTKLLLRAPAVR